MRRLHGEGRLTAAVCAAPLVLAEAGLLSVDTDFTCHPSTRERLLELAPSREPRVIRSGTILTSQGPGTALEFALAVVDTLRGPEVAAALSEAMLVPRGG